MSVNKELKKRIEFTKKYKRLVIRDSGRINHLNSYKIHLEVAIWPIRYRETNHLGRLKIMIKVLDSLVKTVRKKVISLRKSKKKLKFDYI